MHHRRAPSAGRWLVAVALAAALGTPRAAAAERLVTHQNQATIRFAESMEFRLEASPPTPVQEAVLRFRTDARGPVNRRRAKLRHGERLEASFHEELLRGEIPAGATVTWWWTLTDRAGRRYETAPRSLVYLDERFEWTAVERPGVRVWTYGSGQRRAAGIADQVITALDRLEELVGSRPREVIQIVGYLSDRDMQPALIPRGEVYESKLTTLGARIARDIILLRIDGQRAMLQEVLAHELSHLVLDAHFAEAFVEAPMWLDEGLAMYAEGPLERDEQRLLESALRSDGLLSIRALTAFPGRAELVPLAYAQSRDVVAFLIEAHGSQRFQRLLTALGRGEDTVDEVLREIYGLDQLALYQEYRAARGLAPAATPGPGAPARTATSEGSGQPVCGTASLVLLPALVAWRRRHHSYVGPGTARLGADELPPGEDGQWPGPDPGEKERWLSSDSGEQGRWPGRDPGGRGGRVRNATT